MKAFDPNYKLLDEMYQDNYYPTFLVDKVKDELQKVIDLLESGETDTEVVQETLDEAVCGINDLQEEFDEHDSEENAQAHPKYQGDCGDWLNWTVPDTDCNLPIFSSGWGDGYYPVYFGYDAKGEVCAVYVRFIDIEASYREQD